eukprot:353206-Chlamydomonas_euryale.AAC.19
MATLDSHGTAPYTACAHEHVVFDIACDACSLHASPPHGPMHGRAPCRIRTNHCAITQADKAPSSQPFEADALFHGA